ncbi:hypothetical protein [Streptomyces asiaticus]
MSASTCARTPMEQRQVGRGVTEVDLREDRDVALRQDIEYHVA